MLALVDHIKTQTQLHLNGVYRFSAKVKLNIEMGPYVIKTAETSDELISSFKLRDLVFNQEFRGLEETGLDCDKYDYYFDHLIIVHQETRAIIGTYRLNCSTFSKKSYTENEFDISMIKDVNSPYLELGRACIHKDFRKGAVISLLWRGIAEYMKLTQSQFMFGCSSVKVNNPREAALLYCYFQEKGVVTHEFLSKPTDKYTMFNFDIWWTYFKKGLGAVQLEEAESLVPSLLKSYIKQGAKIACEPAYDAEFDCIDFLTVLKRSDLSNSLAQKMKIN